MASIHVYSTELLENYEPPCLSLYQPTHRGHPENRDDPIRFRNLIKDLEQSVDVDRFFRVVDRAILEHHSPVSGLPLILAALPEHYALFRQVSHYPFLLDTGLEVNPDALPADTLRERAWKVVEPKYLARLAALVEEFGTAKAQQLGAEDIVQIAKAAAAISSG